MEGADLGYYGKRAFRKQKKQVKQIDKCLLLTPIQKHERRAESGRYLTMLSRKRRGPTIHHKVRSGSDHEAKQGSHT